jgi:acetyl esterase/lipase
MAPRAALLAVLLLLGSCSDDAADQLDARYVTDGAPEQRLDLYLPSHTGCDLVPLVVWVHGGGWRIGDKGNAIDAKVRHWNEGGWAVASVNYRLTDVRAPAADRVMAPSHDQDLASALAWLVAESDDLGTDPHRIAVVGHSAGAGIAAAVAVDPTYLGAHGLGPSTITCTAPLDTEGFDIRPLIDGGGATARLYRSVFGDDPATWDELSPLTHVGEAELPDLFLVRRGTPARRAQVDAFADAARDAGAEVTVVDLPGFTHEDVNKRIGDPNDDVLTPALQTFLEGCLRP